VSKNDVTDGRVIEKTGNPMTNNEYSYTNDGILNFLSYTET